AFTIRSPDFTFTHSRCRGEASSLCFAQSCATAAAETRINAIASDALFMVRRIYHESVIAEFRGFLTKTNALALAVGVIIGAAVASVVSAVSSDVLMPIIGLFLPGGNWRDAKIVLATTTHAPGKITQ